MRSDYEALQNDMRLQSSRNMAQFKRARIGTVDTWDPEKHVAKVKFQPGDRLSGWIPVGSQFVGDEFGFAIGLSKDDQVVVTYQEGSLQTGMITHRLWNDKDKPIKKVESGEAHFVGKDKQHWKMLKDKTFELKGYGGEKDEDYAKVVFDKDGNIVHTAKKGDMKHTVDKGSFEWTHSKGDATFKPGSGKKVKVQGGGQLKRVMLEDGSFSDVLLATNK